MQRYIDTRYLEELGCIPLHSEKRGLSTVNECRQEDWDEWDNWNPDSQDLNFTGKSTGKRRQGEGQHR